jgi:hypothetical protein
MTAAHAKPTAGSNYPLCLDRCLLNDRSERGIVFEWVVKRFTPRALRSSCHQDTSTQKWEHFRKDTSSIREGTVRGLVIREDLVSCDL